MIYSLPFNSFRNIMIVFGLLFLYQGGSTTVLLYTTSQFCGSSIVKDSWPVRIGVLGLIYSYHTQAWELPMLSTEQCVLLVSAVALNIFNGKPRADSRVIWPLYLASLISDPSFETIAKHTALLSLFLVVGPKATFNSWNSIKKFLTESYREETSRKMLYFLIINLVFMFVELAYGLFSNSLGLITDSFHMLFDCLGLFFSLCSTYIS